MTAIGEELLAALASPRGRELVRDVLRDAIRGEVSSLQSSDGSLLTVDQAASLRETTCAAIYKMVARGTLPAVRHGRTIRIRRSDLIGDGQ